MNIYANENFPQPAVDALKKLGHDVLTTRDAGKHGQAIPDEDVLSFAHEQQRVLITFNRKHFIKLHQIGQKHSGIIVCTIDINFNALAERIDKALDEHRDMNGNLIRVNRPNP